MTLQQFVNMALATWALTGTVTCLVLLVNLASEWHTEHRLKSAVYCRGCGRVCGYVNRGTLTTEEEAA